MPGAAAAPVKEIHPLPYLGNALDAGMAAFFAEEIIEAIRYRENPRYYVSAKMSPRIISGLAPPMT